jgi:PEP-CTERM motif
VNRSLPQRKKGRLYASGSKTAISCPLSPQYGHDFGASVNVDHKFVIDDHGKKKGRTMSALMRGLISVTAAVLAAVGTFSPSHATALFGLISWTSDSVITTTTSTSIAPDGTVVTTTTTSIVPIIDPPSFSYFDMTIDYDPAMFEFIGGGTLCGFGVGGDCPPINLASGFISPIPTMSSITMGTALPGSTLTLTDSGSSVHIVYDLSGAASAPVAGADVNFFGLVFVPLVPLADAVTIHDTPGAYDITYSSVTCTLSDMTSCRTDDPTYGYTFYTAVPEPSTWAIMLIGFAGLGFVGLRSGRKALPTV